MVNGEGLKKYAIILSAIFLLAMICLTVFVFQFSKDANVIEKAEHDQSNHSPNLKVMTFNLRTMLVIRDENPWRKRRTVVKELIMEKQPDVIGTQEGIYLQLRNMKSDLPEYDWIGTGRNGGVLGEYMAVFYKKERLIPLEHDSFWLSDTPEKPGSKSWGNRKPRMVTWVKFLDLHTDKEFYFMNTHLDNRSIDARQRSAELIIEKTKSWDTPILLTGDFNSAVGSDLYQMFQDQGGMNDAYYDAEERFYFGLGTFHGFQGLSGARSFSVIDWILYKGDFTVLTGEVIPYRLEGQYPSDHFPVMVELEWNNSTVKSD